MSDAQACDRQSVPAPAPAPVPAPGPAPGPTDRPRPTPPVEAVLLDADGVLQLIGTPWDQALAQGGGPEFATALLAEEEDALSGRETLTSLLNRLDERLHLTVGVPELLELWWQASPDPEAWQVVRDLRAAGLTTVLATNQQPERRDWMRRTLGYDGLCDVDAYSCELGVAKPDPAYFRRVLGLAGVAEPARALFVDDNARNVAAAASVGIRTLLHPADSGGAALRAELREVLGDTPLGTGVPDAAGEVGGPSTGCRAGTDQTT